MICPNCGNEFEPPNQRYKKKFCSRSCSNTRKFTDAANKKRGKSISISASKKTPEQRKRDTTAATNRKIEMTEHLLKNGEFETLSQALRRKRILNEQGGCCLECGIGQEWNSKPLSFQLDHIDGDRRNNTRSNLRMICPNCHTQTPTYGSKNNRRIDKNELIIALEQYDNPNKAFEAIGLQPSGHNYKKIKNAL